MIVINGDVPLITSRGDRRARCARTRGRPRRRRWPHGARRPERLRARRPRRRRRRRARRRDQGAGGRHAGGARHPRGQHRALRVRRRRAARRARPPASRTTSRASSTCPTSCRCCGRPACGAGAPPHRPDLALGVNDRVDLAHVSALAQQRIHGPTSAPGSRSSTPASTLIEAGVTIGPDTVIEPSSFLRGETSIGARLRHRPADDVIDTRSATASRCRTPTCRARRAARRDRRPVRVPAPGRRPRGGRQGGHVRGDQELDIGRGSKVPHLSYIGDAEVGERPNLGASTITANYDGVNKHRTTIGAGSDPVRHVVGGSRSRSATTPIRARAP